MRRRAKGKANRPKRRKKPAGVLHDGAWNHCYSTTCCGADWCVCACGSCYMRRLNDAEKGT